MQLFRQYTCSRRRITRNSCILIIFFCTRSVVGSDLGFSRYHLLVSSFFKSICTFWVSESRTLWLVQEKEGFSDFFSSPFRSQLAAQQQLSPNLAGSRKKRKIITFDAVRVVACRLSVTILSFQAVKVATCRFSPSAESFPAHIAHFQLFRVFQTRWLQTFRRCFFGTLLEGLARGGVRSV